jgi:concanavalin A-like lectin/glucanase superfamily protein
MSRFSPGLIGGGLDQFTTALLHLDGNFNDVAKPSRVWTIGGSSGAFSGTAKFGSNSFSCGAQTAWFDTPDSTDFTLGAGDFTVDCWINPGGAGAPLRGIFGQNDASNSAASLSIEAAILSSNVIRFNAQGSSTFSAIGATAVTTGVWHHIAFVRSGGSLLYFLDGVLDGSGSISGSVQDSSNKFAVGREGELSTVNTGFNGLIDEFRLSVGIARWTANFTPPTAPYS